MKKYFPNQQPNEKILYAIRHHWFLYIPNIVFSFLVVAGLIGVGMLFLLNFASLDGINIEIFTVAASMVILTATLLLLHGFVDQYLDLLIITDERVIDIKQNGFFKQKTKELHHVDITDVETEISGVFGVYLKFGDLTIKTGSEHEEVHIDAIPRAAKVARMLMDLHTRRVNDEEKIDFDTLLIDGIPNCVLEESDPEEYERAKHTDEMQKDDAGYYFWTRLK